MNHSVLTISGYVSSKVRLLIPELKCLECKSWKRMLKFKEKLFFLDSW